MQDEEKTCCIYFSIDSGVRIIFSLAILDMFLQVIGMLFESLWAEYLPVFFLNLIFVLMFAYPWYDRSMNTRQHRRRTALFYFVCIALVSRLWIAFGLTGLGVDEVDEICRRDGFAEKWYNGDEISCRKAVRTGLLIGVFVNMTAQIYYSYILKLYAEDPDAKIKVCLIN